jgi:tRNA A-37 threonylcarbamoyl transferase component Bud32/Tfp pilus assembly protein PilF/TolB-like protein
MRADSALLNIASSIADGEPIDWSAAAALATDERERALISRLKIIASIGDVHRSTDDIDGEPSDGASTLDVRGRVVGHIRPAAGAIATGRTPPAAPVAGDPASTGVSWGRLLLQERVGAGVYGEVYRAFDESLRRDVAVKLLRSSGRSAELLAAKVLNEGRLLARVRHRNVVTVHGVDTHDGRVGLWMEFIRGNTLEQLLERQGPFGGREASLLGQDLCRALAAVHAAGLVHRDVKAQNVIREEGGRLVLMDFGTGLLLEDDEAVKASPVAGTPLYLSPEVLGGADASPQSDIYSLGVLLFHLVTGSYPYVARSLAELRRMQERGERKRLHDLRPDLSEGFVHVVERALESDPAERYASVGAMQRGLTHALGLESGLMSPVTLAGIAEGDAALRASTTLTASDAAAVARPVVRPTRWQVWLPILIAIAIAGAVAVWAARNWSTPPAAPATAAPLASLVIEPFDVVSTGDQALAEGIGEVVMERVRLLPGVRVVSYSADPAVAASQAAPSADAVLARHQVDGLVRGTATWNDGLARVRVRVLRAGGGAPVFEQAFDRPVERAAELPRIVATEMVRRLGVSASSEEASRLSRADDAKPAVFEAYLRGRSAMRHLSEANVVRAIEQFKRALAANRDHAPSLVGLAECYLLQGVTYGSMPRGQATTLAREAIGRALALDGDHAAAVNADAQLRFYLEWDGDGAERAFQRALQLTPNSDAVHQHYAMFLVARGRMDAALSQVQSAVAIDPASIAARAALGMVWHYTGNQRQAERTFLEVLAVDGKYSQARKGLVRTLLAGKQYAKVLGLLDGWAQGSMDPQDRFFLAARGIALAGSGQLREARQIADDLLASPKADGEVDAAAVLVAVSEPVQALTLLQQAVAQRSARTLFLPHDARFESLRSDTRFTRILDSMDFKR